MVNSSQKIPCLLVIALSFQVLLECRSAQMSNKAGKKQQTTLVCRMVSVDVRRNNQTSAAVSYFNVTYRHAGKAVVADGHMQMQRMARFFSLLSIKITRCPEAVSYNTCEYFDTWKYKVGVCGLLQAKNMPWTAYIESYSPPFRCPVHAGAYTFTNAYVDGSTIAHLPVKLENTFWVLEYDLYDEENNPYLSSDVTFEFKRVRV